MGTAIRYLKYEISLIDQEMAVEEVSRPAPSEIRRSLILPSLRQAKSLLLLKIDSFIRDRILLADKVIEQHAIDKIQNGETILSYARSSVVEGVLLEAKRQGKEFSVVVVDSRPLYEGTSGSPPNARAGAEADTFSSQQARTSSPPCAPL